MAIDWMSLTYLVIGFFALVGFFRGWWKEALTTFALILLLILLQRPELAQAIINAINWVIATVWQFVVDLLNLTPTQGPFQLDAASPGTWIVVLILALALASLIARSTLPGTLKKVPGQFYKVSGAGRIFGLLLGALNGFLILGLVREYLDGRALPGNTTPGSELVVVGSSAYGPASTNLSIQAVNVPSTTILDSYIPWLIIGIGVLIFAIALKNRIHLLKSNAGRKVVYVSPYGYTLIPADKPKPPEKKEG